MAGQRAASCAKKVSVTASTAFRFSRVNRGQYLQRTNVKWVNNLKSSKPPNRTCKRAIQRRPSKPNSKTITEPNKSTTTKTQHILGDQTQAPLQLPRGHDRQRRDGRRKVGGERRERRRGLEQRGICNTCNQNRNRINTGARSKQITAETRVHAIDKNRQKEQRQRQHELSHTRYRTVVVARSGEPRTSFQMTKVNSAPAHTNIHNRRQSD